MINIVYSFIGCFFALVLNELIKKKLNKNKKQEIKEVKEMPTNIKAFADPLMDYKQYKEDNNLYKTYVPKRNERRNK